MSKETVREKISDEIVRTLDVSKVKAITFAEVGAQGRRCYVEMVSDLPDRVSIIAGTFGFEAGGIRYVGDVDIEVLENTIPFLKRFRGTSLGTLNIHFPSGIGNHGGIGDCGHGRWVYIGDHFVFSGPGNHFFIALNLVRNFMSHLGLRHIDEVGIEIVANMLKGGEASHVKARSGMMGAIVGDIVGSRFEWHNRKSKRFTFLKGKEESQYPCHFTDDSVMTLAVADAITRWRACDDASYEALSRAAIGSMQRFGRRYPYAGYGGAFRNWLQDGNPEPYNSWGNGAAMRVSACGWAGRSLDEVKAMSRAVTEVSHNHPEGIKGAEATAVATFLARTGKSMDEIRAIVVRDYYPLDFTLDEIRPTYEFDESCQGSVPQALEAFFESTSFEDAIRNAVSIGGDSDTLAAITGAVAGAFYGVPEDIRKKAETFLDEHLLKTLHDFEQMSMATI